MTERQEGKAHARGPWKVRDRKNDGVIRSAIEECAPVEDFRYAVDVPRPPFAWGGLGALVASSEPDGFANARLIAAAPDLLAACEALVESVENMPGEFCATCGNFTNNHDRECSLAKARAAISAATHGDAGKMGGKVSKTNDGGRAFPVESLLLSGGNIECGSGGMSLRDWFATHASERDIQQYMNGHWDDGIFLPGPGESRERARFLYADAMLLAREPKP